MQKQKYYFLQLLILMFLVSSANAGWRDKVSSVSLKEPTVTFQEYKIKKSTQKYVDIDFMFIVDNPNPVGVNHVMLDYELFVKGNSAGSGKDMKLKIKSKAKTPLTIPLRVKYLDVFKSSKALTKAIVSGKKSIPFTFDLVCKLNLKLLKFSTLTKVEGEMPLPDAKSVVPKIKNPF